MMDDHKCIIPGISSEDVEDKAHRFVHERMDYAEEEEFSLHICQCDFCSAMVDEYINLKDAFSIAVPYKRLLEAYNKNDLKTALESSKELLEIGFDDEIWNIKEMIKTVIAESKKINKPSEYSSFNFQFPDLESISITSNDPETNEILGLASKAKEHENNKEYDAAAECYKNSYKIKPLSNTPNLIGKMYSMAGKYNKAVKWLTKALDSNTDKDKFHALYDLGFIYEKKGMFLKAVDYYSKALELRPDNLKALHGLGFSYLELNMLEEAEIILEKIVLENPHEIKILATLGILYLQNKRIDKAEIVLDQARSLAPDDLSVINSMGVLYSDKGNFDEAIKLLDKSLLLEPDSAPTHNNIALAYYQKGQSEKAIEHIKIARDLMPDYQKIIHNFEIITGTGKGQLKLMRVLH